MESVFCSSSLLSVHHHHSSLKTEKKQLGVGMDVRRLGYGVRRWWRWRLVWRSWRWWFWFIVHIWWFLLFQMLINVIERGKRRSFGEGKRNKDFQPLSLGLNGASHLAALCPPSLPLFLVKGVNHPHIQLFLIFSPSPRWSYLKIGTRSCSNTNHNLRGRGILHWNWRYWIDCGGGGMFGWKGLIGWRTSDEWLK